MKVQAIAKSGGLWIPWHGNFPEGSTVELEVVEVTPSSIVGKKALNSPETFPVVDNITTTMLPDNAGDAQTLDRILDALYSATEYTASDKTDKELWQERMLEKHG